MTVTRDVVKDLLPVSLAGDASADTRRVVEAFLQGDSELARDVEAATKGQWALPATAPPAPTAEKQTLDATRQVLRNRTSTMVTAILFTVLPFSFAVHGSKVTFLLFRDEPVIAAAWWFTAGVLWIWHVAIRARARVSGL